VKRDPKEGRARVHLHGRRNRLFGGPETRIEIIEMGMVPMESEAELVRCAVAASPSDWHVGFGTNVSKFAGRFTYALDARLKATLVGAQLVSASGDA
jgi:hypothetical protein